MIDKYCGNHSRVSLKQIFYKVHIDQLIAILFLIYFIIFDQKLQNLAYLLSFLFLQETEAEWIYINPNINNFSIGLVLLNFAQSFHTDCNAFYFNYARLY